MSKYYEITKEQADLIGTFTVDSCTGFSPYTGIQVNGNYVVRVDEIATYSNRTEIQEVDFSGMEKKELNELDFYYEPAPES